MSGKVGVRVAAGVKCCANNGTSRVCGCGVKVAVRELWVRQAGVLTVITVRTGNAQASTTVKAGRRCGMYVGKQLGVRQVANHTMGLGGVRCAALNPGRCPVVGETVGGGGSVAWEWNSNSTAYTSGTYKSV